MWCLPKFEKISKNSKYSRLSDKKNLINMVWNFLSTGWRPSESKSVPKQQKLVNINNRTHFSHQWSMCQMIAWRDSPIRSFIAKIPLVHILKFTIFLSSKRIVSITFNFLSFRLCTLNFISHFWPSLQVIKNILEHWQFGIFFLNDSIG